MKINPIAVVTILAVGAAGTFGYLYIRPAEKPAATLSAPAVPVAAKVEAPKPVVKPPEEKLAAVPVPAPPPVIAPSFDTVHVETGGEAVISGRAAADADVVAKLNGTIIATAKANAAGEFVMIPDKPLPVGAGTLSLESNGAGAVQVSSNTVAVAVKEPEKKVAVVTPAPLVTAQASATVVLAPPASPQPTRIIIQPGNNLWTLSRDLYGAGRDFTVIYEANKDLIRNPGLIYPGQVITAPIAAVKKP